VPRVVVNGGYYAAISPISPRLRGADRRKEKLFDPLILLIHVTNKDQTSLRSCSPRFFTLWFLIAKEEQRSGETDGIIPFSPGSHG
jgi:hypothetical protein